jgi:phosphomannomutase/phosphoglucomutase
MNMAMTHPKPAQTRKSGALIPAHVFREYDIRGIAFDEIDRTFCYRLGRAFGDKVKAAGYDTVIVGHDNRHSSPEFHRALITGLQHSACNVFDIGMVTTSMFYYALHALQKPNGIMITASHNPGNENGFKIAMDGTTIYGEAIQELRKAMLKYTDADGENVGKPMAERMKRVDIEGLYMDMLADKIRLTGGRPFKVVVDCGSGTASPYAPKMLRRWGCEVVELYCESDPDFPHHHPDPVDPRNLVDLIETVKKERADLGIAFDGDGDRLGVVDDQGSILWGDQLMILFWREILPKYPGCQALVEVKCSKALVEEIEKLGGRPVFHRTGHSHIKASMRKLDTPFTGEMSGHLFFRDEYYGFDDALYAAGRLLRILDRSGGPLSRLFADVPRYYATPETRVPCEEGWKKRILNKIRFHFHGTHEMVEVDGIRVLFPDGWGLVRSSNTQPILVLRAEADTEEGLKRIKREMEKALAAASTALQIPW